MKHPRNPAETETSGRLRYALRTEQRFEPRTRDDAHRSVVRPHRTRSVQAVRYPRAEKAIPQKTHAVRRHNETDATESRHGPDTQLFIAMMSHELRSPVTTILGYAHLLARAGQRQLSDDQRDQAIADIDEEANRLRMLIDNLMTLAQPANVDALRDQLEPTLVHRIVEHVIARHVKRHPDRRCVLEMPSWVPPARAVPGYVDQIIDNFITNAEKYSLPRAAIEVEVRPDGAGVAVRVLDRGPGIDEAEARQLFSGFYRSSRLLEQAPGNGIGLAVCKRLAEAQGGRVWACRRPGGGSEFAVWLPAERSPDAYNPGA